MTESHRSGTLNENIVRWLRERGLPLELRTAHVFASQGFQVWPSYYVTTDDPTRPREIDVLASIGRIADDSFLRFSHVVECKWSHDKPWVVFVSEHAQMAPSKAVTSGLGNATAEGILWLLQDDPRLQQMMQFQSPFSPGFGGRVGFTARDQQDPFYGCMQAIVAKTRSEVGADDSDMIARRSLATCAFGFPIVVVDGELFAASYDPTTDDILLATTSHLRVHWRGHPHTRYGSHIDIVVSKHLPEFLVEWKQAVTALQTIVESVHERVIKASTLRSPEPIADLLKGRSHLFPRAFRGFLHRTVQPMV